MDVCTCPCTRGVQAQTHTLTLAEMLAASAEICRRLHVSSFGMDAALPLFSQADLPSVATLGKAAKFPCAAFPPPSSRKFRNHTLSLRGFWKQRGDLFLAPLVIGQPSLRVLC